MTMVGMLGGLASPEASATPIGELQIEVARLANTGRVLYVAAHPDDENTRLLAYLANARHLDVAYLSMTRGGGGQNLIGSEQADLLGIIRTQELLQARARDGARQLFTRARDFGYTKRAEEATARWGEAEILGDVVWAIRRFRPDVVITRFTESPPNHGHHTASARLARAAVKAAADPERYPEHLARGAGPWAVHRLMLNVPRWGRSDDDVSDYLALDVGAYDPRLGLSYGELAARSRTMHKSQGFGSAGRRGPVFEYFETLEGPKAKDDPLEGVDATWRRLKASPALDAALKEAARALTTATPEAAVAPLARAHGLLDALAKAQPVPRVLEARARVAEAALAAAGLFARATSDRAEVIAGEDVPVTLEVLLRRPAALTLTAVDGAGPKTELTAHSPVQRKLQWSVPPDAPVSAPYWLARRTEAARLEVTDPALVGEPEGPPARAVRLTFSGYGATFTVERPVVHTSTDRVHGERVRRVLVTPPATVTPLRDAVMLPRGAARPIAVAVRSAQAKLQAKVRLEVPKGWTVSPAEIPVALAAAGDERTVTFSVTPPAGAAPAWVRPLVEVAARTYDWRRDVVDHPHFPVQVVLRPSGLRLSPVEITPPKGLVGYVPGSGDSVADDLRQVGVEVETLSVDALRTEDLSRFSAIVLGIRAYNVVPDLVAAQPALFAWVKRGGTLITQYNTSSSWRPLEADVAPYDLTIGRGRVTDETARIRFLAPKHPALHTPHEIRAEDLAGWVQERGLYFGQSWDRAFTPLLSMADPGQSAEKGSLLVARHGQGTFVYTGLSFFRQLPAGVPGAYRLLVNLLSL